MFETPSSTEWNFKPNDAIAFKPNVFIDIENQINRKLRAMKCYSSEVVSDEDSIRHPRNLNMLKNRATPAINNSTFPN